ncbi:ABC transporter permease [Algiphilus sp. W345]|uniref:ABC transporter permease n=1 Tax=Banduia mediterranea TaxID=3075609 RepID=A0ABU2WDY1_9GAMM|nr:ABC transporter permease [Algiphilus sp. W345]MDT0496050.1 ABC transporter permease [Algiphilus sp. W345]
MKYFPLIWATLWRKKARTLLTLLSIIIAFFLFGMLQGVNSAINHSVELANVDRLISINRVSLTEPLPMSYLSQIKSVPGVEAVAYSSWFGSYYQEPKQFVFGSPVDAELYFPIVPEVKISEEAIEKLQRTRTGAVVGIPLMEKYGWGVGDRIPIQSTIWTKAEDGTSNWEFDIVGTYDVPENPNQANGFYFNYEYFEEARAFTKGTVGWYFLKLSDPSRAAEVAKAIDARFANSSAETKTQSEKEFQQSFIKQFGDINFIVNAILGAVFFTLLFLTGNTMMQSVRERIPELAVLKTLGFSDGKVVSFVVIEALMLCLLAALIGLGLSALAFPALKGFIGEASLQREVIVTGISAAIMLALVIALMPASRALRLSIVDALAGR